MKSLKGLHLMKKASPRPATIRVHLIFNAHLDPVWLWNWESGLDAGLATYRSACDRLDEYPDLTFAAGDAWVLAMVEQCDPTLFDRIKAHVASGRWSLYGGWWVQPDCNIPTRAGFEHQIALGREFLTSRFGRFTDVARNVDSFGHTAALPEILQRAGQLNYMMMRPGPHEMRLPARVFQWRGFKGAPAVLTFRIADPYCWGNADARALTGHILNATSDLPPGVTDTMCLLGLGDHGGGPTQALIATCQQLKDAIPGVTLLFSTPERYFAALRRGTIKGVPEVVGELQYHAIGCYALQRAFKLKVKRAEHLLDAVQMTRGKALTDGERERMADAWKAVCFNQFHDTMGGTCIPSAYELADAQAGAALAWARETLSLDLRRAFPKLGKGGVQRLVLRNITDRPFSGLIDAAPWGWNANMAGAHITDQAGKAVPFQTTPHEGNTAGMAKRLFKVALRPREIAVLNLHTDGKAGAVAKTPWKVLTTDTAVNKLGFGVSLDAQPAVILKSKRLPVPQAHLIEDHTDTWTHNFDRYLEGPAAIPQWGSAFPLHAGPVAAALSRMGRLDGQEIREDLLVHADAAFYELGLRVNWMSKLKVLKLVLPFPGKAVKRVDGTAAGRGIERRLDGAERPICDWMLFTLEDGSRIGIVCPEILAADADERRVRLTLLRSPVMANHLPAQPAGIHVVHSDHGVQSFRIGFDYAKDVSETALADRALAWMRPPLTGDLTVGMPPL